MPGLPQNTLDASSDSRVSSNTSVLVSASARHSAAVKKPAQVAATLGPEKPVPFGPVTFRMLTQVTGVPGIGSEMKVKSFQVHSKLRLPDNVSAANGALQTPCVAT